MPHIAHLSAIHRQQDDSQLGKKKRKIGMMLCWYLTTSCFNGLVRACHTNYMILHRLSMILGKSMNRKFFIELSAEQARLEAWFGQVVMQWLYKVVLCYPYSFKYLDLGFSIEKPSHITNIHCKFEDFFPRNLRIIKVLHSTSHIIRRTGKMIKINSNIAFSGLKFDRERAKI